MKKIVFFSGGIHRAGGTERVLTMIANSLSKNGYEVTVVSLCGENNFYPLEPEVKVIYIHSKSLSSSVISNINKLRKTVKTIQPDYWVDVDYILGIYTKRIRNMCREMKWISWEHFCFYYQYPYYNGLRKKLRQYVCKHADCVVVLSKEDRKDYLDNLMVMGQLKQIYNPIPYNEAEHSYEKEKIVLAAGRLTKIKGFDRLLEAWGDIEKDFPEWKLIIAGEGEEKENLLNQINIKKLANVEITGFVKDMESLYRKASVFALPSRNEGFVMVLLEAMAYGIPLIAFNCKSGVKEMIDNGGNGYIVENDNINDFSKMLRKIMADEALRDRMSIESRAKAKEFTVEKINSQWMEMLESI